MSATEAAELRMRKIMFGLCPAADASGPVTSFVYLDQIYDRLLTMGVRPFVELSFMPTALASGRDAIFWYRGNTTPPRDMRLWAQLIDAFARHVLLKSTANRTSSSRRTMHAIAARRKARRTSLLRCPGTASDDPAIGRLERRNRSRPWGLWHPSRYRLAAEPAGIPQRRCVASSDTLVVPGAKVSA